MSGRPCRCGTCVSSPLCAGQPLDFPPSSGPGRQPSRSLAKGQSAGSPSSGSRREGGGWKRGVDGRLEGR